MYNIDKDVPVPEPRDLTSRGTRKQMILQLEVGQSFLVPNSDFKKAGAGGAAGAYTQAAKRLGMKITTKREPEGVRVWRVE